jgi:hypothetical protein
LIILSLSCYNRAEDSLEQVTVCPKLGTLSTGMTYPKGVLLAQGSVRVPDPSRGAVHMCYQDLIRIESYRFHLVDASNTVVPSSEIHVKNSGKITGRIKYLILHSKSGETVVINQVKSTDAQKKGIRISELRIRLEEK